MDDLYLCQLATNYLRRILLGVPGFILFEIFKQFLQAQGIFQASTYVLVICAPLNVILNFTLVWDKKIGLGFIGAPTAVAITNWVMATLLLLYIIFIKGKECWCGFTPKVFTNWGRTLSLAGPGVLMIEAEWLAFEIITFAASRFGTDSLAAQSIVSTACVTTYQFSFAIAVAASTRIAWFVGSASKQAAWKSAQAALLMSLCSGSLMGSLLYIFRDTVTSWFSTDPEVISLSIKVLTIGAFYQIGDSVSCVTGGVLRGQGRQYIGGWLNLFCYYVLSLPIAFLCGFNLKLELFGLWIGVLIGLYCLSFSELWFVLTSDWDAIIRQSIEDGLNDKHAHESHHPQHDERSPFLDVESAIEGDDDDEGHLRLRAKSVSSFVDYNMLNPGISTNGEGMVTDTSR
ncbi:unnamed protein product [Ambrosiozyma monospora]|uniref:Unnamed protein product n=1 Tax=Ambrosiozyma monospora TaxID=43982 RepID=A0ACB5TRW3_AMBMO|nr:unnamed protein product [Ambrosiozyma monospora]